MRGPGGIECVYVDQNRGPHHIELHQVEERRAAGQVVRRRHGGRDTAAIIARRCLHCFG
jgi:hypothetical protein